MNSIGKELKIKTTDAEEIINLLHTLLNRSETLRVEAQKKLSCVIVEHPTAEHLGEPHPVMSPIFYDMFRIIKDIEHSISVTEKNISDAQLPIYYNEPAQYQE